MKILRTALVPALYFSLCLTLFAQEQSPKQLQDQDKPATPASDQQPATKEKSDRSQRGMRGQNGGMMGQGAGGTITDIKDTTITIKTRNGKTATAKLSPETKFIKNRQPVTLKDFKVGDRVMVGGEPAGEDTWNAKVIALVDENAMRAQMQAGMGKEFIAGEVKSIDEAKLTILRVDGQTQVIEADENTSFKKQGESITLADIKPGDHVMGRGELKNGVFVPMNLRIGDFPQMQMMQSAPVK